MSEDLKMLQDITILSQENLPNLLAKAKEHYACQFALDFLSSATLEDILQHPKAAEWAYWYASEVLNSRWPEAEDVIKTDPMWAYSYAVKFVQARWPEAEDVIKTDPKWARVYAEDVLLESEVNF
jgi:hypothetical protein